MDTRETEETAVTQESVSLTALMTAYLRGYTLDSAYRQTAGPPATDGAHTARPRTYTVHHTSLAHALELMAARDPNHLTVNDICAVE